MRLAGISVSIRMVVSVGVVLALVFPTAAQATHQGGQPHHQPTRRAQQQRNTPQDKLDRRWDQAVRESQSPHPQDIIQPRIVAVVLGAVWLWLMLRRERRMRRSLRA